MKLDIKHDCTHFSLLWKEVNIHIPKSFVLGNITYGEGNVNPLQYSCLENSMDGGAWWATVHGARKSQTRLSNFTFFLSVLHISYHKKKKKDRLLPTFSCVKHAFALLLLIFYSQNFAWLSYMKSQKKWNLHLWG